MGILTFQEYFPKKPGKPPTTQIHVMRYLTRNGPKKRTEIADFFGKNRQEVNDALEELIEKELVETWCELCQVPFKNYHTWESHSKENSHKNLKRKIRKNISIEKSKPLFKITKNGFVVAIDDKLTNYADYNYVKRDDKGTVVENIQENWKLITDEEFWKQMFESFNASPLNELREILEVYDNKILKVDKSRFVPQFFFNWKSNKKHEYFDEGEQETDPAKISERKIIEFLGYGDPLPIDQLQKTLKFKPYKINLDGKRIFKRDLKYHLRDLRLQGLIQLDEEKYDLTHLGVIELLFYLYREVSIPLINEDVIGLDGFHGVGNSKHKEAIRFNTRFELIRKKYLHLFPKIFGDEIYGKLQIDAYETTALLMKLYKNEPHWRLADNLDRDNALNEEFQSLVKLEQIRQEFFFRKISDLIENLGIPDGHVDMLLERIHENPKMNHGMKLYAWLCLFVLDYHDWKDEAIPYFFYSNFSEEIQNRIAFDFYLIYKAYCGGWTAVNFENSKIRKDHDDEISKLLDFSKEYVDNMKSLLGKEYH